MNTFDNLKLVNKWLIFAEVKLWALLTANILLSILMVFFGRSVYGFPFMISALVCLYGILPNIAATVSGIAGKRDVWNPLFYGDIASNAESGEDYLEYLVKIGIYRSEYDGEYLEDGDYLTRDTVITRLLANEIVCNSHIANKKYKVFTFAIVLSILGCISGISILVGQLLY